MPPLIQTVRAGVPANMDMLVRFEPLMDASGATERLVAKLQRNPPNLIYMALDPEPITHLVDLLRKSGIGATVMRGQRLLTYRFLRTAAAEGVQVLAPLGPLDNPEYLKAVSLLERSDVIPDLIALNSYAAIQTWAEAVRKAGSGEHGRVVEVLQSTEVNTAIGPVAFDLRGDRRNVPNTRVMLKNGRLTTFPNQ
jgi:branched-chain amino acid transport system substrate-binding protein